MTEHEVSRKGCPESRYSVVEMPFSSPPVPVVDFLIEVQEILASLSYNPQRDSVLDIEVMINGSLSN
jgi:hypothetical protein